MEQRQQQQPPLTLLGRPPPSAMLVPAVQNKRSADLVAHIDSSNMLRLTNIAVPTNLDVLCGRGVATNRHVGNENFRALVKCHKETYVCSTKAAKMKMSRFIVQTVRQQKGRFLEKEPKIGLWMDIGDKKAIEKTSQALRDGAAPLRRLLAANAEKNQACDDTLKDNTNTVITKDPSNSDDQKIPKMGSTSSKTKKPKLHRKVTDDEQIDKIEKTTEVAWLINVAKKDLVKKRKKRVTKKAVVRKSKLEIPRLAPKMVSTDSCLLGIEPEPVFVSSLDTPPRTITSTPSPLPQQQNFTTTTAPIAVTISPSPNLKSKNEDSISAFPSPLTLLFSPDLPLHVVERGAGWNLSQNFSNESYDDDNDADNHYNCRIPPQPQLRARVSRYDYDCGTVSPSNTIVPPYPSQRPILTSSSHTQVSAAVQLSENPHPSSCQPQNNRIPHHPHHHHRSFPHTQSPAYLWMPMKQYPLSEREQHQQQQQQHRSYEQKQHPMHDHHVPIDVKPLPIGITCPSHISSSYACYNDQNRGEVENATLDVVCSVPRPNMVELSFEDKSRNSSDDDDDDDDEMSVKYINEMVDEFDDMAPLPYRSEDECLEWETAYKPSDDNSLGWDVPNGHDVKNRFLMNLIQSPLLE